MDETPRFIHTCNFCERVHQQLCVFLGTYAVSKEVHADLYACEREPQTMLMARMGPAPMRFFSFPAFVVENIQKRRGNDATDAPIQALFEALRRYQGRLEHQPKES